MTQGCSFPVLPFLPFPHSHFLAPIAHKDKPVGAVAKPKSRRSDPDAVEPLANGTQLRSPGTALQQQQRQHAAGTTETAKGASIRSPSRVNGVPSPYNLNVPGVTSYDAGVLLQVKSPGAVLDLDEDHKAPPTTARI